MLIHIIREMLRKHTFKFILGGSVSALFNLFLIFVMIDKMGFNSPLLRNVANIITTELSLIFSFFIYRIWVWTGGNWKISDVLKKQLFLYHLSAGSAICTRVFIVFPILDWIGISYSLNTLVGIMFGAVINYVISDRVVFNEKNSSTNNNLFYPEGLELSLCQAEKRQSTYSVDKYIKLFSIVIPAHNEEDGISLTLEKISETLEKEAIPYEILVVNDNSGDSTEEVLKQICDHNSKIHYINNYYPNGFGFAVRCGLENYSGDAVTLVMADYSDSPENIIDYYNQLCLGYECVFGSRFIKGGKVIDYPSHKLFINRLANLFIKVLFGLDFNDTTNAFKAYHRKVIEGISPLISHHFNLTVELPLKAIVRGYSYSIIPIIWSNRKTGVSKLRIKEMGSRYLFIVLYIFLEKLLSHNDYFRKDEQFKN